jgi:sodium/hydrogen antiporter
VLLLAITAGSADLHLADLGTDLALGVFIGVAVPWLAILLERTRFFAASAAYEPLNAVAIGLLVLALGKVTHGNLFLAAFAAGVTVATVGPDQKHAFERFGELVAEVLKLAALLVFGALISVQFLGEIPWTGWAFALSPCSLPGPWPCGCPSCARSWAPANNSPRCGSGPKASPPSSTGYSSSSPVSRPRTRCSTSSR